jgi:ATP-binding cassette subfamily A (ABC1) protein 3
MTIVKQNINQYRKNNVADGETNANTSNRNSNNKNNTNNISGHASINGSGVSVDPNGNLDDSVSGVSHDPFSDSHQRRPKSVPSQPIVDLVRHHLESYQQTNSNSDSQALQSAVQQFLPKNQSQQISQAEEVAHPAKQNNASNAITVDILSDAAGEISFRIPFRASSRFSDLFRDLDDDGMKNERGISHYGISVTTLEEVFLRVGMDLSVDVAEKQLDVKSLHSAKSIVSSPNSKHARITKAPVIDDASPYLQTYPSPTKRGDKKKRQKHNKEVLMDIRSDDDLKSNLIAMERGEENVGVARFLQHMRALLTKRLHNIKRDKRVWCCQLLIPFIILLLGMALMKIGLQFGQNSEQSLNADQEFNQPLRTPIFSNDPSFVFTDYLSESTDAVLVYDVPQFWNDKYFATNWTTASSYLLDTRDDYAQSKFGGYMIYNASTDVTIMHNMTARDSIPVFWNLFNRAYLRFITGKPELNIQVTYKPYPMTNAQSNQYDTIAGMWLALALGFIPPTFAAYVVRERSINIKHLQIVSGVNLVSYWLSNWLFDFLNMFVCSCLTLPVLIMYDVSGLIGDNLICTAVLAASFSFSAAPYVYLMSYIFNSPSGAQNFILLAFFVTGPVLSIVVFVLMFTTTTYPADLNYLWRCMPNYAYLEGLNNLLNRETNLVDGLFEKNIWDWEMSMRVLVYMWAKGWYFSLLRLLWNTCCKHRGY